MKITSIKPWLVKAEGTYWGEYFFIEVTTDEGVNGWGEITTTTKMANRTVAGMIRQLNDLLVGDDPTHIERIWHKIFRTFTYMGSRGATCQTISGIDIALWDIRGKVLGAPIYDLLGGSVRDDILLYCHPDQSQFTDKAGVEREIRAIIETGHTLKPGNTERFSPRRTNWEVHRRTKKGRPRITYLDRPLKTAVTHHKNPPRLFLTRQKKF